MKKFTTGLALFFLSSFAQAQNGLENIIVETYYVSDANDSIGNDLIAASPGSLPAGSVTYRIYADMLPGYKFQAAYGVNSPGDTHEFSISTTTLFFNNEDRGATTPNAINNNFISHNTVMLDSWLSVGGASSTKSGILKNNDDGVGTVVNVDGLLQNTDASAGIPLTTQDGLIAVTPPSVTLVGITNEVLVFDNQNDGTNGPLFSTTNGSLACLNGATGPDSVDNKVLIAQITTDGILCFQLNIQIGTPGGGVENYVAQNPTGTEISIPSLTYCSSVGLSNHNGKGTLFLVYPNPVSDLLKIKVIPSKGNAKNSYTISDITGKVVLSKDLGTTSESYFETANLSSLAKGVYIITLTSGDGVYTKKIIKN